MKKIINLFQLKGYWKLIIFVFLCAAAAALFQPYQSVFLKEMKNATSSQIGMFVSLNSIAGIFFSSLFAKISDKHNHRKGILTIALFSAIAGYIAYKYVKDFYLLLAISLVFIGISTMITAQMFAFAKDILESKVEDTEPYITILRTIVSFAWVFSPLLAAVLIKIPQYTGIIWGTIIGYVAAGIILHTFWGRKSKELVKTEKYTHEMVSGHKPYAYIIINFSVFTILESINVISNTNIPLYITDVLGYSSKYVGFLTGFSALVEIPCMIFLAYLSLKKIKIEYMVYCGIISSMIFFVMLKNVFSIHLIIFMFIFKSIFNAVYKGIGITFFQKMIPQNCGISTTLFTNTTRMGAIVGGVVVGSFGGYKKNFFLVAATMGAISFLLYLLGCKMEKHYNAKCSKGGE